MKTSKGFFQSDLFHDSSQIISLLSNWLKYMTWKSLETTAVTAQRHRAIPKLCIPSSLLICTPELFLVFLHEQAKVHSALSDLAEKKDL